MNTRPNANGSAIYGLRKDGEMYVQAIHRPAQGIDQIRIHGFGCWLVRHVP